MNPTDRPIRTYRRFMRSSSEANSDTSRGSELGATGGLSTSADHWPVRIDEAALVDKPPVAPGARDDRSVDGQRR